MISGDREQIRAAFVAGRLADCPRCGHWQSVPLEGEVDCEACGLAAMTGLSEEGERDG